jgi:hypothetical protein
MIVRNTTKVVGFLLYHVREEGSDTGSGAYYYILISRQKRRNDDTGCASVHSYSVCGVAGSRGYKYGWQP